MYGGDFLKLEIRRSIVPYKRCGRVAVILDAELPYLEVEEGDGRTCQRVARRFSDFYSRIYCVLDEYAKKEAEKSTFGTLSVTFGCTAEYQGKIIVTERRLVIRRGGERVEHRERDAYNASLGVFCKIKEKKRTPRVKQSNK